MGMDVYGRNPKSEAGRYFRANIWSWSPIHLLCVQLCEDILSEETLHGMAFNDGAGPESQEVCDKMVDRFEKWMEHHADGLEVPSDLRVTSEGRILNEGEVVEGSTSIYKVSDTLLKEWINFLRDCGGFQVR